jgi:hypothetical protein
MLITFLTAVSAPLALAALTLAAILAKPSRPRGPNLFEGGPYGAGRLTIS